jgi:hypothetical protein
MRGFYKILDQIVSHRGRGIARSVDIKRACLSSEVGIFNRQAFIQCGIEDTVIG